MAVEKDSYEKVKKFMNDAKTLAAQNGIVFDEKISYGNVGYNIVKFAHNKNNKIDMIVIASRGRGTIKEIFFWKCFTLCPTCIKPANTCCKISKN